MKSFNVKRSQFLTLFHTIPTFNNPEKKKKTKKPLQKIVRKGKDAGYRNFPECFLPFENHISIFQSRLVCYL